MPFPMIHLCMADEMIKYNGKIADKPEFFFGSLAPDAVHFRPGYNGEYKKLSHICIESHIWGQGTDNRLWQDNVLNFLKKHKNSGNIYFYCGYCGHIIADIIWNDEFWTPYRNKYENEIKSSGSRLHKEENEIDYMLYKNYKENNIGEITGYLTNSECTEIPGIVPDLISIDEVKSIKENILYKQYSGRQEDNSISFELLSYDIVLHFIKRHSPEIADMIFA